MPFDIEALKTEWRARCQERGIDPAAGATTYQVANVLADRARATHHARMAALVEAHAFQHAPSSRIIFHQWHPKTRHWELKRWPYGNWDDGRGCLDAVKVDIAASRLWWLVVAMWSQRNGRNDSAVWRPAEVRAIALIREDAKELLKSKHVRRVRAA